MSKGRRAADRRREREGHERPGAPPEESTARDRPAPRGGPSDEPSDEQTRIALDELGESTPAPIRRRRSRKGPTSAEGELADALLDSAAPDDETEVTRPGEPAPRPPAGGAVLDLDRGYRLPLERSPSFLGRGSKCALKLDDPLVSRVHCHLSYVEEEGMWVLEDLRSKNGTLLNGQVLGRPRRVVAGDVIELGDTHLRFGWHDELPEQLPEHTVTEVTDKPLYKGEPTRTEKAPPPKKKKRSKAPLLAALGVLLLLGAVGGVGTFYALKGRSDPAQIDAQVEQLLEQARALLQERQLDAARARLETIFALRPGDPKAKSLLRTLQSEVEARAALERARTLLEQGKIDAALVELKKIADSSLFADDRDEVLLGLLEKDKARELAAIEALIEAGQIDEALARLAAYLERNPDDPVAGRLQERAQAIKSYKPPPNAAVVRAQEAFAVGNPEQARIIATEEKKRAEKKRGAAEAASFLDELDRFEALYRKGKRALRRKRGPKAEAALDGAYELAGSLSGQGSGRMRRDVGRDLADALLLVALRADRRGDECAAAHARLRAFALDPEDNKTKAAKRALDKKARAALERARAKRGSSPEAARKVAAQSQCYASPSSTVGKALRRLAR